MFSVEIGRLAGSRIREAQEGWVPERVAAGQRAAVYAVATADRLGREDLTEVRFAAETEQVGDPMVALARWFDEATYPPETAPLTVTEALARLGELEFDEDLLAAFRAVQPLIQPVGLD